LIFLDLAYLTRSSLPLKSQILRRESHVGHLEPNLVIALSCCAVAHGIGLELFRHLHLLLGDDRPGQGSPQEITRFINRVGPQSREHIVPDEFLFEVFNDNVRGSCAERLSPHLPQLVALAHVCGKANDRALVGFNQPSQNDRRVQPSGIGQNDFVDVPFQIILLLTK
jgi:hypothetical protein